VATGKITLNPQRSRVRSSPLKWAGTALWVSVLLLFAFFFLVPLFWLLLAPTKADDALVLRPPLSFGNLETFGQTARNLLEYNGGQIWTWARNSIFYCITSMVLTLLLCIPAGYALGTAKFTLRRPILILTLVTLVMPRVVLVLPIFLEMKVVGLVNNPWGVILASSFFPAGVYLLYLHFATSLPKDILNAGRIDGANDWHLFYSIALPLAKPMIALVAFFSFVATWNEYFLVSTLLYDDRLYNLPIGLSNLMSSGSLTPALAGNFSPIKRPEVALAGLILVLPVILIFLATQRAVRPDGLSGGEKG